MPYPIKLLLSLIAWFLGLFVVPLLCLITPQGERKWRYLDRIYGNKIDGLDGDPHYVETVKLFRRYRWTALRNPINNLLRRFGPNGTITRIVTKPNGVDYWVDGERYWYRQWKLFGRLHFIAGYPNWDDQRINSKFKLGHHFEQRMLLWPFKML